MKKIIIIVMALSSAPIFCQKITSIQNVGSELIVNDSIHLHKGSEIQVNLPAGRDFVFIKKKSGISPKLLGRVADVVGTGASAVGFGSGNLNVLKSTAKVVNVTNAVSYGADALDKIQDLPISNDAKKIAGQKVNLISWMFTDNGYVATAELQGKKYEIFLQEAAMAGEVKL